MRERKQKSVEENNNKINKDVYSQRSKKNIRT